jgi:hypothetical protein
VLLSEWPGLAEELAQDPGLVDDYLFSGFLEGHRGEVQANGFGWAFDRFVWHVDPPSGVINKLREAAEAIWAQREAQAERERAQRLARFEPANPDTWEFRGDPSFASRLDAGRLGGVKALQGIATGLVGFRESRAGVRINTALHAHMDSGSGGVAFFYAVDENGSVFPHFYAESDKRQGNSYRWDGFAAKFVGGPPELENIVNDPVLKASQERVAGLKQLRKDAAAAAAKVPTRTLGQMSDVRDLAEAVRRYHDALTEVRRAADATAGTGPAAARSKKGKKAKAVVAAAGPSLVGAAEKAVAAGVALWTSFGADVFVAAYADTPVREAAERIADGVLSSLGVVPAAVGEQEWALLQERMAGAAAAGLAVSETAGERVGTALATALAQYFQPPGASRSDQQAPFGGVPVS